LVGEIFPSVKITDILPETAPDRARQNETVESRLHGMVCVLLNLNEPQSMAMKLGEHLDFNYWISGVAYFNGNTKHLFTNKM
jgi:hypothetical protein